jgi:hypothetical protein
VNARVTACSTDLDVMTRLLRSLKKLDSEAIDEAKQQPGVTYADTVRKVPVHDEVEQGLLHRPRFTPRSAEPDMDAAIGGLYPELDGFSPHAAEYAALMAEVDAQTGTTGTGLWRAVAPAAIEAAL